jgi:hypothetical protein
MKALICLTALSLLACGEADFSSDGLIDPSHPEAGSDGLAGTGGSDNGSAGKLQAGKAGASVGGTDSGMAGAPAGIAGMATAGQGSSSGGMPGIGAAGSGNAGSPAAGMANAGAGMGGSDSPMAGSGNAGTGIVAGAGGDTSAPIDSCDPSNREGGWSVPNWNWGTDANNGKTTLCTIQMNRIGKSLLTLEAPAGCGWENDIAAPESWEGCRFVNTLTCEATSNSPAFTVKVSSQYTDFASGHLVGMVYYDAATAGNCVELANYMPSMSFSADRF